MLWMGDQFKNCCIAMISHSFELDKLQNIHYKSRQIILLFCSWQQVFVHSQNIWTKHYFADKWLTSERQSYLTSAVVFCSYILT